MPFGGAFDGPAILELGDFDPHRAQVCGDRGEGKQPRILQFFRATNDGYADRRPGNDCDQWQLLD